MILAASASLMLLTAEACAWQAEATEMRIVDLQGDLIMRIDKPGTETRSDLPEDERIEKTVVIKVPRSLHYGDGVKLIDIVKGAGANPIILQVDDLPY
jgi:biopolymer transport protein ExbD